MFNNSRDFQVLGGNYYVVNGDLTCNFNVPSKEFIRGVTGDSGRSLDSDIVLGSDQKDAQQLVQGQQSTEQVPMNCSSAQKIPDVSIGHGSNIHAKNGLDGDSKEDTAATESTHTINADAGEMTETIRVGGTVNLRVSGAKEIRVVTTEGRVVTILLDP